MKITKKLLIFTFLFVGSAIFLPTAYAQNNPFNLTFPISELGNCSSYDACKAYCDNSSHTSECLAFAKSHNLGDKEEIRHAEELMEKTGPGGCRGIQACQNFCENPGNQPACVDWAVNNGQMTEAQAKQAKKFLEKAQQGGPGGCKGPRECQRYCQDTAHQEECFKFAEDQGFVTDEDKKDFEVGRKLKETVEKSGGPGGCKTEDECQTYCSDPNHPDHIEACVAFATVHGGIPEEKARQMLKQFIEESAQYHQHQSGASENISTKEYMESFQEEAEKHFQEFKQLEKTFRGPEIPELQMPSSEFNDRQRNKMNFVGPGGCTYPDECIKYCIEHKDQCFSFSPAGKPGVMQPEGEMPPGNELPQIRSDITHEVSSDQYKYCQDHPQECMIKYSQQQQNQQPSGSSGTNKPNCPLIPTVSECPAGQVKTVVFSSPECGTYYACQPASSNTTITPPSSEANTSYSIECTKRGGTWTGTTCKISPPTPSSYNSANSNFLANVSTMFLDLLNFLAGRYR